MLERYWKQVEIVVDMAHHFLARPTLPQPMFTKLRFCVEDDAGQEVNAA